MNLLFLSVFICGVVSMPFSFKHANHLKHVPSLLQMYKKNPVQFIDTMSKINPTEVNNIITLLKDLLQKSEAKEALLKQDLEDAKTNLGTASTELVDAQENEETAVTARETAESNLVTSKGIRDEKQRDHDEAKKIRDDQVDGLNDEAKVLSDVIDMLKTLLTSESDDEGSDDDHVATNEWSEFSRDVACEDNGHGRAKECDVSEGGDLDCCKAAVLAKGFKYVVWWHDSCYGTDTCNNPYNLADTVNYHYDGAAFIETKKNNFLSLKSFPAGATAGRKLLSLESGGLSMLKHPKEFIAEMSKAEPSAVREIIGMLEDLKAANNIARRDILTKFAETEKALGVASAQVVADETAVTKAKSDEAGAKLALTEAETAESTAQNAQTEAQNVHDAEIAILANEQDVLNEVIRALENLIN